MITNRAIIYAIVVNIIYFCFSGYAVAYQRYNAPQQQNDTGTDATALAELYPQPSDYLWLEQHQLTARAYDALQFIADSISHGLNPNDYHQDLLEQLDPAQDVSNAHIFDLMLSDGILKLIRDISTGRLDPAIVDPKWAIPRAPFNAVEFLREALAGNQFKEHLLSLVPTNGQYRRLEAAAKRYQQYVDRGGWSTIALSTTVHPGETSRIIPAIRDRLVFEDASLANIRPIHYENYDEKLEQAVRQFQRRHSLVADGVIGPATILAMNVSAATRLQQIKINMERLRWLPDKLGDRYIMVNLANYQLTAIEDEQVKLNMRVIVGKTKRPTPSFSSKMTHIVFNPRWHVPGKLARLDLLPRQQADPDYLASHNFRVFINEAGKRTEVDPESIDWQSLSAHNFPYTLRQEPGDNNALGRLKFVIPNPWAIYLHDTPSKSLFNRTQRNFSSGCIRVENPLALAYFSLTSSNSKSSLEEILNTEDVHKTKLEQPLAVYAIYSTVWFNGNELTFSPDSYHRDQKMAKYL
ncbi:MAG: L,D-transpeptidase family protein [Gammaproteobacteria bacterium]|nr:L,D-transpeptidase family protein [Gammaproteobacteria bacterium]